MFFEFEILSEEVFDFGFVDYPAGDDFLFLFFLDDDIGGIDLFFVQFAAELFFNCFDSGFFLIAKLWLCGY